jgi:phosphoglucosamine mutase
VIDCANGAAANLAPKLFQKFGAEIIVLNCEPDGRNINEDCGSTHLEDLFRKNEFETSFLREKIIAEKADFGVALDGDADRALFVDEQGNFIDGDAVLWIMAQYLQEHGRLTNQKVIATEMSNIGLELALKSKNIELSRTDVGDKYVLEELLKTNSAVGGEQSGHIIFPNRSFIGDGMMTTLCLLEAMRENKKTLSEMTEGFVRFPQILVNVEVGKKVSFKDVAEIAAGEAQIKAELGSKGRLLLRYSGTQNLARVMIEGENQSEIDAQANRLAEIIKKSLG